MGLGNEIQLPFSEDQAIQLLHDMAVASMTDDSQAMQQAVQELSTLSPTDKKRIEDIVAMMPYPGILPMQVQVIFSDPEQFIGAIGRIGSSYGGGAASALGGATAASIVLAAVLSWLQTEHLIVKETRKKEEKNDIKIEELAKDEPTQKKADAQSQVVAKKENAQSTAVQGTGVKSTGAQSTGVQSAGVQNADAKSAEVQGTGAKSAGVQNAGVQNAGATPTATTTTSDRDVASSEDIPLPPHALEENPINAALSAYIASGTSQKPISATESLQFLRNNPVLLSSLSTVDPALLVKAYQIAEAQIIIGILDKIIEMQAILRQEEIDREKRKELNPPTPSQTVLTSIRDGIKTNEVPISQSVVMAMQLLLIQAGAMQIAGVSSQAAIGQPAAITPAEGVANLTVISTSSAGLQAAKVLFPNDTVATSVLVSFPTLFPNDREQLVQPEILAQLGVLASVYAQMAPYWSIPAAVSFQMKAGKITEKSVRDAAVRAYVLSIQTLINDPAFALLIKNSIQKSVPDLAPKLLAAYIAAVTCALLVNALVVVYLAIILKKTSGQFSTKELADMILGKVPLPPDTLEGGLIKQIQMYLKDIPESYREAYINQLLSCYNANTKVQTLIDPATQFLLLCDQSLFRNTTAAETA